jgi:hypothetical protein
MIHSPLKLEILLQCYTLAHPDFNREAPAVREALSYLHNHSMIDRMDFPKVTDKGEAYIKHILKVPFPVQRWEIPDGNLVRE